MTQIAYRANLSSAIYPMTVAKAGRSVIVPGQDNNFDRRVDPEGSQKDAGIPQAIYMENVLPTPDGFQSVGFKPSEAIPIPPGVAITAIVKIPAYYGGSSLFTVFVAFFSNNTVRSSLEGTSPWIAVGVPAGFISPVDEDQVTHAAVRGTVYVHIYATAARIYTFAGDLFVDATATFTGLPGLISGICSSYNYLLIQDSSVGTIYWSSTATELDFVASLVSGAGFEIPGQANGQLIVMKPHPAGFYIYCAGNVLIASYTGNRAYPWKFREINNSGAFPKQQYTSDVSTNSAVHIGITLAGQVQSISPEGASSVMPEVSDYLEKNISYDSYNSLSDTFQVNKVNVGLLTTTRQIDRKIAYILDKYIFLSIRNFSNAYQYSIVYDGLLKRYGKVFLNHTHIFEVESTGAIFFLDKNTGLTYILYFDIYDFDTTNSNTAKRYKHSGVLVLGKFQYVRERLIQLEEIEVESSQNTAIVLNSPPAVPSLSVKVLPSLNGKDFNPAVAPYEVPVPGGSPTLLHKYLTHVTATNHSIVLKNAFDITSLSLKFNVDGRA